MSETTSIEWADSTFNPWEGCTKVGPGCDHCYAEVRNARFGGGTSPNWGAGAPRRRTSTANWRKPLKWDADAALAQRAWEAGVAIAGDDVQALRAHGFAFIKPQRPRVFCASLADWLDNEVPIEWLVDLLDLIRCTPNLDWLMLTKRIGNWHARITRAHQYVVWKIGVGVQERGALWDLGMWLQGWLAGKAPSNVWIGATVVNQDEADRDVPKLLKVQARVRFLSVEPMLGSIDLRWMLTEPTGKFRTHGGKRQMEMRSLGAIHWVIAGGESGPGARPAHPEWLRFLRDHCAALAVPFLFKQWGEWLSNGQDGFESYTGPKLDPERVHWVWQTGSHAPVGGGALRDGDGAVMTNRIGRKAAGRLLDGVAHNGFPVQA